MRAWSRLVAFLLAAAFAFWFAVENVGQVVTVDLGLFRVRASLVLVVFVSVLLGMLVVFMVGLRADLETRRAMERYREMVEREERPVG